MSCRTQLNQTGFTLIELIVALVLLGICVVGLMPVFQQILGANHRIGEMHQAQLLAQEKMAEVLEARWGSGGFNGIDPSRFPDEIGFDIGGPVRFDRAVEIQGGSFNGNDNSFICSGAAYINETHRCVFVTVRLTGEGTLLARRWTLFGTDN
jgi:prepilin-type N-terminal cleavage/methylation domain-containing protein